MYFRAFHEQYLFFLAVLGEENDTFGLKLQPLIFTRKVGKNSQNVLPCDLS